MDRRKFITGAAAAVVAAAGGAFMALDYAIPPTAGDWRRDIERRLRNLERSPQLIASSVKGGQWRILSPDGDAILASGELDSGLTATEVYNPTNGNVIARLGELEPGIYGVAVGDGITDSTGDTWFLATQHGLNIPRKSWQWMKVNDPRLVTSGTFVGVYRMVIESVTYRQVFGRFVVACDAGTSGEVRLRRLFGGNTTNTISIPSSGDEIEVEIGWDISDWAVLGSGPVRIDIEVRRTGGAGNVIAYWPYSGGTGLSSQHAGGLGII